jgi:HEPN domain-containing protein
MNKEIALKWLKQAKPDLEIAEKNTSIGGYDIAAFLSHQPIEKTMKKIKKFLINPYLKLEMI